MNNGRASWHTISRQAHHCNEISVQHGVWNAYGTTPRSVWVLGIPVWINSASSAQEMILRLHECSLCHYGSNVRTSITIVYYMKHYLHQRKALHHCGGLFVLLPLLCVVLLPLLCVALLLILSPQAEDSNISIISC